MEFDKILFLDGATGTVLQQKGLKPGGKPEHLNIENPEMIQSVAKAYADAGSQIVCSNTFGANGLKLKDSPYRLEEIVAAAIENARAGAGPDVKIALDIGPLGELMEPMGSLTFEKAYELFAKIIQAGVKAGADLILFETMSDLLEVKAGVLAAKENSGLPVFASMSFEANGRTFTGCTIESMGMTLTGLGVDALGMNCSVGPDLLAPLVERLAKVTSLPIIAKPNAGMPDPMDGHYDMNPDLFLEAMKACVKAGASIIGGCCGTNPDYIEKLTTTFADYIPVRREEPTVSMVCSPLVPVLVDHVTPIGERINPTGKKRMQKALLEDDLDYLVTLALQQQEAGAKILDVNVGYPGVDEEKMLEKVVRKLQSICDLPLQLDSSNPKAIEKALRIYNGKPSVNSINAKQETMDTLLPVIKKYGAAVVGLTINEDGIPTTAKKRVELAQLMLENAKVHGIPARDLWIDPLCLTVSAQQDQAAKTLSAIRTITDTMGLNTVLGISNISFGLPWRRLVTQTFLIQAMSEGLRLPIINPNQQDIMDAIYAYEVLSSLDSGSKAYIERFQNRTEPASAKAGQAKQPNAQPIQAVQPDAQTVQAAAQTLQAVVQTLQATAQSLQTTAQTAALPGSQTGIPAETLHFTQTADQNAARTAGQNSAYPSDVNSAEIPNGFSHSSPANALSSGPHSLGTCPCCSTPSALQRAVIKGLDHEASKTAKELLENPNLTPLMLVEQELIPALDQTGQQYENGKLFLPQLLSAANAAQAVFEVLKDQMAKTGEASLSKGTIVLATVQGDVHDIGKNIVKTVLENYGFTVLDLGKDVAPERIVDTVKEHNIQLVGLSALMTTTLPAMEKTVRLLKALDHPPKIMVGGAVVTQAYADQIGADFYGKDASASAAYAKEVFS